jgi:uncharacterized protein (DUF2236 family)
MTEQTREPKGAGVAWTPPREPKGAAPTGLRSDEGATREGGASRAPGGERDNRASGTTAPEISTAVGLVERYAAAFVAGVPDRSGDDGFFGPGSATWRLAADLSAPVAGLRSVLLQALHPLAMAGVDQHSDWRRDPVGRLAATSTYLAILTYGDRASASRAAARVRAIHEHVRGTDTVTGRPYAAGDPALLLWVHAALVDSVLAAAELFGTPPAETDADAYVGEMAVSAEMLGVPREMIPDGVTALRDYIAAVRPELRLTPAAAESMGYMLDPAGMGEEIAELWQDLRDAALTTLPGWAQDLYGYPAPPPMTPERRTEIRQTLGVFDAVFLAEPGVLEARQQLALRMRAAAGSGGHGGVVSSPGGPGERVPPEKRVGRARG